MTAVGAEAGGVAASGGGGWRRWRLGCGGLFCWGWGGRGRGVGGGAPSDGVRVVGVEDVPAVDVTWLPALVWVVVEDVVFLHSGARVGAVFGDGAIEPVFVWWPPDLYAGVED
eukprot:752457-Prymnesium_polylepis.1